MNFRVLSMNYLLRLCGFVGLFVIIYEAVKFYKSNIIGEQFLGNAQDTKNIKTKKNKKKTEDAYKIIGTPTEWYDFNELGYTYLNSKLWSVPQQYQPVCYTTDDVPPSPIMSAGTDNAMFYKPGKDDKFVNDDMVFEINSEYIWNPTSNKPSVSGSS